MNKDYNAKDGCGYGANGLTDRVLSMAKPQRDGTEEVKFTRAKEMPIIPVTGGKPVKYFENKSPKPY